MFGEYMVYVNDKPILLVCDNIIFVKQLDVLKNRMNYADEGHPYNGAKEHNILDIENRELSKDIVAILEGVTSIPKQQKKKSVK